MVERSSTVRIFTIAAPPMLCSTAWISTVFLVLNIAHQYSIEWRLLNVFLHTVLVILTLIL